MRTIKSISLLEPPAVQQPWPCFPWPRNLRRFYWWSPPWQIPSPGVPGIDISSEQEGTQVRMPFPMRKQSPNQESSLLQLPRITHSEEMGSLLTKTAAEKLGAKMIHEEYCPMAQTDHTSSVQRIIDALKDKPGEKYVFVVWAGKNPPIEQMAVMKVEKYGIKITTGGNILPVLKSHSSTSESIRKLKGNDRRSLLLL